MTDEVSLYVLFTSFLLIPPFWAQMSSPRHPFLENLQLVISLDVRNRIKQYQTYNSVFLNLYDGDLEAGRQKILDRMVARIPGI
jgi:hypothetical protein